MPERKRLGQILVDLKVLSQSQVERVLQAARRRGDNVRFGRIAKDMGLVRDEHILAALAVQLQLLPHLADQPLTKVLQRLGDPRSAPPPVMATRSTPPRASLP